MSPQALFFSEPLLVYKGIYHSLDTVLSVWLFTWHWFHFLCPLGRFSSPYLNYTWEWDCYILQMWFFIPIRKTAFPQIPLQLPFTVLLWRDKENIRPFGYQNVCQLMISGGLRAPHITPVLLTGMTLFLQWNTEMLTKYSRCKPPHIFEVSWGTVVSTGIFSFLIIHFTQMYIMIQKKWSVASSMSSQL